ncbi:MAG TPA: class I SAM-dependent methyltransferase [Acidimicrobiales bacterium]|nr:class I SAM-dependent methyltransferase [Acidimicrobiales bacterium]
MTADPSPHPPASRPGDQWRQALRHSAVPQSILDAAPDPEPALEPERFRWKPEEDATQPVRPSRRRALEALPEGGTVLDVGVGGGASSLGLVPKVGLIIGVDSLPGMLEAFQASAREAGVAARAVLGTWPQAANEVEPADVAVCHHAIYRVEEIEDFATALTARARRRVVVELSANPPLSNLNPLWKVIHGMERADWRVADEAERVFAAMGLAVEREDMVLPPRAPEVTPELVAFARRRLYVGPDRDPEIEAFLRDREPGEHRVVALWWPGAA